MSDELVYEITLLPDGAISFLSPEEFALFSRLRELVPTLREVQVRGPLRVQCGSLPKSPAP